MYKEERYVSKKEKNMKEVQFIPFRITGGKFVA